MIKVVFFAALREQLNCESVSLDSNSIHTIADVKKQLSQQGEQWQQVLNNSALLSAVNHDMVDSTHAVKSGDEVAFFPPVTGG